MRASIAAVALLSLPLAGCQGAGQRGSPLPLADFASMRASNENVIHSFSGPPLGEIPESNPIVDASGRLYGNTVYGGTSQACGSACGTIFALSQVGGSWKETTLWSFDLTHGAYPAYPLVADSAGNLYGATDVGGVEGVAYRLARSAKGWRFGVLHNFKGDYDGAQPESNLIFDKHGNLYGTTASGGTGGSGGGGTVYELIHPGSHWTEQILYRFSAYGDGATPQAGVIFGRDGSLYGTTQYGGNTLCPSGCGVVYKLAPAGKGKWMETVLHAFDGSDGESSVAGLVADGSGNLYGTANLGGLGVGCHGGCGTLFEMTPSSGSRWSFSVLHDFAIKTGGGPLGNMVFDAAGNLYGTTVIGGNLKGCLKAGCGVVFELSPRSHNQWKYTVLHAFNDTPDGAVPAGLTIGANGKLYGTTRGGGELSLGTVFEVTP